MPERRLHVLFGDSAAGSLREALLKAGRPDQVVCFQDHFEFGPINPPDPILRTEWVDEVLGVSNWEEVADQTERAMAECAAKHVQLIAWVSRRDAHWYSGFLEWLFRVGDAPCDIVDVTDLVVPSRSRDGKNTPPTLAISPSSLAPGQFIEGPLLDSLIPLAAAARDQYRTIWKRLRLENSPLRIVGSGGLLSAPITAFDSTIKAAATADWRKMARVLGEALLQSWEGDFHPVSDLVLTARIRALAEAGHLEWRGDLFYMRNCEIRRVA